MPLTPSCCGEVAMVDGFTVVRMRTRRVMGTVDQDEGMF